MSLQVKRNMIDYCLCSPGKLHDCRPQLLPSSGEQWGWREDRSQGLQSAQRCLWHTAHAICLSGSRSEDILWLGEPLASHALQEVVVGWGRGRWEAHFFVSSLSLLAAELHIKARWASGHQSLKGCIGPPWNLFQGRQSGGHKAEVPRGCPSHLICHALPVPQWGQALLRPKMGRSLCGELWGHPVHLDQGQRLVWAVLEHQGPLCSPGSLWLGFTPPPVEGCWFMSVFPSCHRDQPGSFWNLLRG